MHSNLLSSIVKILTEAMRVLKVILVFITSIVLISTLGFVIIYFYYAKDLPDIHSLEDYKPPILSQVMADDGTVIGEFWAECRIFLAYEKIPKKLIQTFIAAEDSRFFEHKGVDMRSIVRAFIANLKAGEVTQGGSTITQQITRSLLLTSERSIDRKIKEAILATRLERQLDKEQILTLYLNQIFLGNRAYGIGAAARNYFHKTVDELDLAEMALIAGLPSAPVSFSPLNHPEAAKERQTHVLNRMLDQNIITKQEMEAALNKKIVIYYAGVDKDFTMPEAAYFVEQVRRLVKDKYGDDTLYKKGIKIFTAMNIDMQKAAYQAVRDGVDAVAKRQGWTGPLMHMESKDIDKQAKIFQKELLEKQHQKYIIWPLDNRDANIATLEQGGVYKAIVTGFNGKNTNLLVGDALGVMGVDSLKWAREFSTDRVNYDDGNFVSDPRKILNVGDIIYVKYLDGERFGLYQQPLVQSSLFSMDPHSHEVKALIGGYDFKTSEFNRAIQALRQPGSSFKPFIYAAALDKGYNYETTIVDAPVQYVVGGKIWRPKNYSDYKGPMAFQNAIILSRNIPTVKIVADIGTHYLTGYIRKFGITSSIAKYLSMALGANAVTLEEMVTGYSVFLNQGVYHKPIYIRNILDVEGNVLEDNMVLEKTELIASDTKKEINLPDKITENDLNTELFIDNEPWIEKDGLRLSQINIKTLYGEKIPPDHVITPQTAYLMVNLLKGVVERGTATRVKALGKPAAGKTGTTNDETDTWFIGFVPDLLAGVWVGFDEISSIGKKETGGRTAAPIFIEYMKEATKNFEAKNFTPPPDFPIKDIASISGGSAIFGPRYIFDASNSPSNPDRAGAFFEEDLEEYSNQGAPSGGADTRIQHNENTDEFSF